MILYSVAMSFIIQEKWINPKLLHHNFTLRVSTGIYGSRILSSTYILPASTIILNCFELFIAPSKFVKTGQGSSFSNEITYIGGGIDDPNPTCIICVNCSVTGDPAPVVTWEYQTNMPGVFNPVVTNQSDAASPYFVENNGQVSVTHIYILVSLLLASIKLLVLAEAMLY